jgi:hypothetical protein
MGKKLKTRESFIPYEIINNGSTQRPDTIWYDPNDHPEKVVQNNTNKTKHVAPKRVEKAISSQANPYGSTRITNTPTVLSNDGTAIVHPTKIDPVNKPF